MLKRAQFPLLLILLALAPLSLLSSSDPASYESKENQHPEITTTIDAKKVLRASLRKPLFLQAIKDLDVKRVNAWLKHGMDPDAILGRPRDDAKPAILHAIQQIRPYDLWEEIKSMNRRSALRKLKRGAYDIVETLLAHGANPNIEGYCHSHCDGEIMHSRSGFELPMTPLSLASAFGQSDIVELLLDYDADVQGIQVTRPYADYCVQSLEPKRPLEPIEHCSWHSTHCAGEYRHIYLLTMHKLLCAGARPTCWDDNREITLHLGNAAQYFPRRPDTIQAEEYLKDHLFLDAHRNKRNELTRKISVCLPNQLAAICSSYLMEMDPALQATLLHESLRRTIYAKDFTDATSLPKDYPNMSMAYNLLHGGENLIQYARAKRDQEMTSIFAPQQHYLYYALKYIHKNQLNEALDKIKDAKKDAVREDVCHRDMPRAQYKYPTKWLDKYKLLYGSKALLRCASEQTGSQQNNTSILPYDPEPLHGALQAICAHDIARVNALFKEHPDLVRQCQLLHGSDIALIAAFGPRYADMLEQCFHQKMLMHIISLMRTHAPSIYQQELDQALVRNPLAVLNKAAAKFPDLNGGMNVDFKFAAPIVSKFLGKKD